MRNQSSRTARFIRSFAFGIDPCRECSTLEQREGRTRFAERVEAHLESP